jgi:hypothetical protein
LGLVSDALKSCQDVMSLDLGEISRSETRLRFKIHVFLSISSAQSDVDFDLRFAFPHSDETNATYAEMGRMLSELAGSCMFRVLLHLGEIFQMETL